MPHGGVTVLLLLLLLVLCGCGVHGYPEMPCRGPGGAAVDSYVALKAPGGQRYVYASVDSPPSALHFQADDLSSQRSAVGATLQQFLAAKSNSTVGWILYNDETPGGKTSSSYAHAKGVLVFTQNGGFWLVHSVPKFPDSSTTQYSYPDAQSIYGQSFICITVDLPTVNQIAYQLSIDHPQIYDNYIPDAIRSRYPNIARVSDDWTGVTTNVAQLSTVGGRVFTSFAKSKKWGQMLYNSLVSTTFRCGLNVETWMRPVQSSCCQPTCPYPVTLVSNLRLDSVTYTETQDHSKWAISSGCSSGSSDIFCVGDINQNDSQENRGGGTLCSHSSAVHNLFSSVIQGLDKCPA